MFFFIFATALEYRLFSYEAVETYQLVEEVEVEVEEEEEEEGKGEEEAEMANFDHEHSRPKSN